MLTLENCFLMPPMEGMWRLARLTDLGELFPDAPYGGDVEVGQVY